MSEIIYKKATIEDLDSLYENFELNIQKFFVDEFGQKTINYFFQKPYTKERIADGIQDGYVYMAEDNGKIVGFLIQMDKENGGVSFLNWCSVNEEYHSQGIGKALLKVWEDDSFNRGVHTLFLLTENKNIKFYEKCGFVFMGTLPKGYFGQEDNYMYKTIQEPNVDMYTKY